MPVTITCTDGNLDFICCDGSATNKHHFQGVALNDGLTVQRIINPIQIAVDTPGSSVLVYDENGNYRSLAPADVTGAATVNEVIALLSLCVPSQDAITYTKEVFTNVSANVTVSATIPSDTSRVVVVVGTLVAAETDHYTISGQQIQWAVDNIPESETVQVFIFG